MSAKRRAKQPKATEAQLRRALWRMLNAQDWKHDDGPAACDHAERLLLRGTRQKSVGEGRGS